MALCKCQYCNEKSEKNEMKCVKVGSTRPINKYYHFECYENKIYRDKAVELFYDYTKSLTMANTIYVAFKKAKEKGLTERDILYTMEYIIKTKGVLNYPMGMLYYIDRAMRDKKESEKQKKEVEKIINAPIKIMPLYMKKEEAECKNDEQDISEWL